MVAIEVISQIFDESETGVQMNDMVRSSYDHVEKKPAIVLSNICSVTERRHTVQKQYLKCTNTIFPGVHSAGQQGGGPLGRRPQLCPAADAERCRSRRAPAQPRHPCPQVLPPACVACM
jgi:hypothetical protein